MPAINLQTSATGPKLNLRVGNKTYVLGEQKTETVTKTETVYDWAYNSTMQVPWTSYSFEFDCYPKNTLGGAVIYAADNLHCVHVQPELHYNNGNSYVRVVRPGYVLFNISNSHWEPNNWYHWKIVVQGGLVTATFNGQTASVNAGMNFPYVCSCGNGNIMLRNWKWISVG